MRKSERRGRGSERKKFVKGEREKFVKHWFNIVVTIR